MRISPNSRFFDRVPDLYVSPYPGADAYADDAFQALLSRTAGTGAQTVGQALLTQAGAQAWNQATQMLWKVKAVETGDLLKDVWSRVAWMDKDTPFGILAEVPFPLTTDPQEMLTALASVAIDAALDAVTAVPVAGWIVGIVVGIGQALAPIFKDLVAGEAVAPERKTILPWRRYSEKVDESWVRTFLNVDSRLPDWTSLFLPPTNAGTWRLVDGVDEGGQPLGEVLAPFRPDGEVAWSGRYGCLPGTFRVAGILQYRGRPQPPDAALRYYNDGTLIHVYGDFTQTGDFFPGLQQLAGTLWQQIAAGGSDTYKVNCAQLASDWRDWFSALYTSVMDQDLADWLLPLMARNIGGEYRLGASAGGHIRPEAPDGTTVPLVTRDTFNTGILGTARSRTSCFYTDVTTKGGRHQGSDLPRKFSRDPKTKEYIAPPVSKFARTKGHTCIPWPPGELLLAQYKRADDAIVLPAVRAIADLQRRRLARTLDCAYVRPLAVGNKPAYAAFQDKPLRERCLEMRKRLLTHPARFDVEYATALEVDPEFAAALRDSGVKPLNVQQVGGGKRGSIQARPLDPDEAEPGPPLPPQGGVPFDPEPVQPKSRAGLILGGAALVAGVAAALGVAMSRRSR